MKIKENFMLRKLADDFVVVPVGAATVDFNGMLTLNETGAFLFEKLQAGTTKEELLKDMLAEYDVAEDVAKNHIDIFVEKLEGAGLFE